MLQLDVVTLFPDMFDALTGCGVTQRARANRHYELVLWNPRDFSSNTYRSVDDRPYGGGPGMVMMAGPLAKALRAARQRQASCGVRRTHAVYLSPQGRPLTQQIIDDLSAYAGLILLAGRYEGVDERLLDTEIDDQISIGDYVLSGGELPAMVVMDALIRRIPGVLNDAESARQDSFVNGLLDCPQFTRPEVYENHSVPAVLLSGHHAQITRWRMKQSLGRTWCRRPDLLAKLALSDEQTALLEEYKLESKEDQELIK